MQYHDYSCYSFAIHLDLPLVLFALFLRSFLRSVISLWILSSCSHLRPLLKENKPMPRTCSRLLDLDIGFITIFLFYPLKKFVKALSRFFCRLCFNVRTTGRKYTYSEVVEYQKEFMSDVLDQHTDT